MKHLIIFLLPVLVLAQESNPLEFFPHHVGDTWQYYNTVDQTATAIKITRIDTSADNNLLFIYYNERNEWGYKINLDSNHIFIPPNDKPWYKLAVPIGTIWTREEGVEWVKYWNDDIENIWGEEIETKIFYQYFWNPPDSSSGYAGSAEILARGIGILRYEWEGGKEELIGCIIDGTKYGMIVSVNKDENDAIPLKYTIKNFPNPFNNKTTINYSLPTESYLSLKIYDILGSEVTTLVSDYKKPGKYIAKWLPENVSSGVYIAVLQTEEKTLSIKLQYLK